MLNGVILMFIIRFCFVCKSTNQFAFNAFGVGGWMRQMTARSDRLNHLRNVKSEIYLLPQSCNYCQKFAEYNTIASNQAQAPDNALLNMALVQSFNYSSDRLSYDAQESISKSVEEARSKTIKMTDAPVVVQNVCEKYTI
ncbi:hypothetical protein CEXT_815931 [Caerostris extrusa]|uniref:Uncharacterized protein n=1 Tax=Caerostris extrusa TaxID=172846 RepID=A0AAV4VEK8_CAEEX|nr:hypothetical protein CEXT_815931 [Caerostris extrusa]